MPILKLLFHLKVYQKPLLQTYSLETREPKVKDVFHKTQEILNYHLMFQIELSDCVKKYDKEEKIGDIFVASVRNYLYICINLMNRAICQSYVNLYRFMSGLRVERFMLCLIFRYLLKQCILSDLICEMVFK